jgi:hypothetical protein
LTEDCGQRGSPGYKIYNRIALLTNSQVFNINSNGIEKVFSSLRSSMKDDYATNRVSRSPIAGKSDLSLYVDSTISNIDLKLSGESPRLIIRNPLNQIVEGDVLSLFSYFSTFSISFSLVFIGNKCH